MKHLIVLMLGLLVSGSVFADTYCGQFEIKNLDKSGEGPGPGPSVVVETYIDHAEGGPGVITETYTLVNNSKDPTISSLRASLIGLLEMGQYYCFEGTAVNDQLDFTAVKKN